MASFAERLIAAHQAGLADRRAEEDRAFQKQLRDFQVAQLKHEQGRFKLLDQIDELKLAAEQNAAAKQQFDLMTTNPGEVPDTTPGNELPAIGNEPAVPLGGSLVVPNAPITFQGPSGPYQATPPTLRDIRMAQNLAAKQALIAEQQKARTAPFTLPEGAQRVIPPLEEGGAPTIFTNPKPGPITTLTPESVNVDGKGALVLHDNQGNYFDVLTKKPITGRITPYIAPPTPRQRGEITATAEANLIQQLNKQWEAASKDVQSIYRANAIMDAGMKAARKGDLNAGAQAVLVTFQKFLDPTSVVRESEYARSGAGLAMADRIRGFVERLQQGGAGVPLAELEKFAELGKEINAKLTKEGNSLLSAEQKRIGGIADRYGVPTELVIPKYNFSTLDPEAEAQQYLKAKGIIK